MKESEIIEGNKLIAEYKVIHNKKEYTYTNFNDAVFMYHILLGNHNGGVTIKEIFN